MLEELERLLHEGPVILEDAAVPGVIEPRPPKPAYLASVLMASKPGE